MKLIIGTSEFTLNCHCFENDRIRYEIVATKSEIEPLLAENQTYKIEHDDEEMQDVSEYEFVESIDEVDGKVKLIMKNKDADKYQLKEDNKLHTSHKNIPEAINELLENGDRRKIQGEKETLAEIKAIANPNRGDEWKCKEDKHFYLYTDKGWVDDGDTLQALDFEDHSDKVKELNPDLTFKQCKLTTFMGLTVMNIEADLPSPITDIKSEENIILKLPTLPSRYKYSDKYRIDVNTTNGVITCDENYKAFYIEGGQYYVSKNIASGRKFVVKSIINIEDAYDGNNNPILIAEQMKSDTGALIIENGTPKTQFAHREIFIDGVDNPKIYTLKLDKEKGYVYRSSYYDKNGNIINGNFYELIEVNAVIDKEYMYKCYLMNLQKEECGIDLIVDENKRLCTYRINESEVSKSINAIEAATNSLFNGISGDITIMPITKNNLYTEITANVEKNADGIYEVKINGSEAIKSFTLQKSL